MFRTGHRTDPGLPSEIPAPIETSEPVAGATPAAPTVERSAARPPVPSEAVLGHGVTFDGTLRFTGSLRIDGTFKGHITAGDALVIGEGADVDADVVCGTIDVTGAVQGSLTATRSLELRAPARVTADVTTPSLIVHEGVLLEGAVRMHGRPARTAARDRPPRVRHEPIAESTEQP